MPVAVAAGSLLVPGDVLSDGVEGVFCPVLSTSMPAGMFAVTLSGVVVGPMGAFSTSSEVSPAYSSLPPLPPPLVPPAPSN